MATLRDIRQRIGAVKNTRKITSAMKMVAVAKLRRAQEGIMAARPYANKLSEVLSNLASSEMDFVHPFFDKRDEVSNVLVIVVSSDRGLCGAFNSNLLKATTYHIERKLKVEYPKATINVVPVGRKAVSYFQRRSETVISSFPDIFQQLNYNTVLEISSIVTDGFVSGKFDRVHIVFNEFKSMIKQETRIVPLLPVEPQATKDAATKKSSVDYIYEPTRGDILEAILPKYLNLQIWRSLLDSNAAEQAARMMAMDNASTNAKDLINALQLEYNKARQSAITKEMLEIVGGAEALKTA